MPLQGIWKECNIVNYVTRMERSQLPVALPVHESGSPWTTPPDMHNQGTPQPQRMMPMHALWRTKIHIPHYRVHMKDIDTIPLCKRYKLSMLYDL